MRSVRGWTLIACAFLSTSCATPPPKSTSTASGKPEVTIQSTDIALIKAAIIGVTVNDGYQVDKDTAYLLEMHRPTNSKEDMVAAFSIGNSYSSNSRVVSFMFVPASDSTRVIASSSMQAQLPGGQTNNMDLNDNGNVYNKIQQRLQDVKSQVEGKKVN